MTKAVLKIILFVVAISGVMVSLYLLVGKLLLKIFFE